MAKTIHPADISNVIKLINKSILLLERKEKKDATKGRASKIINIT